jgi:phage terminase large subunit-like protein
MGARGPGAKPVRSKPENLVSVSHSWEKRGLSRAERMIRFIESLPVTSGLLAGKKMKLLPFQKDFLRCVYRTDKKGNRLVRQAVLSVARKNGKTGLVTGMALGHLVGPEAEQRGQCYSAANDRAQASILFKEMKAVILGMPWMAERVIIREFTKELEDSLTGSTFNALSADVGTKHGLSPSFVCYDELGQAKGRELYDVLASAQGARKEPLLVSISTQAPDDGHILSELIDYGLRVNTGEIKDTSFHLTLYAAPPDADPWAVQTWLAANPAAGKFLNMADLKTAALQAQRVPSKEAAFRNLRLNQRVAGESRFVSSRDWDACSAPVDPETLRGCRCFGGLDLSSTQDLTALALYFPDSGAVLCWFWLPGDGLKEKSEKDRVPYTLWEKEGHLQTFPGRAVDRRAVALQVAEIASMYDVQAIGFDRWRFEDLRKIMLDEGITVRMESHGQGFKDFSPSIEEFERLLLAGKLKHGKNPVLRWCASNAVVVTDPAGNRKLDKAKSTGRIDGLISLVMACGVAAKFADKKPLSVSDFSGSMVLSF